MDTHYRNFPSRLSAWILPTIFNPTNKQATATHTTCSFPSPLPKNSSRIAPVSNIFKMSDVEENNGPEEIEVSADAPKGQLSVIEALQHVLKKANEKGSLARGLSECTKALDRREAHMCVLNENCEEDPYKKLIIALCAAHNIPLIKVPDGKQLGEWAGLCVVDRDGNARKVVGASCVVVKDWGEDTEARPVLLKYFQTEQQ